MLSSAESPRTRQVLLTNSYAMLCLELAFAQLCCEPNGSTGFCYICRPQPLRCDHHGSFLQLSGGSGSGQSANVKTAHDTSDTSVPVPANSPQALLPSHPKQQLPTIPLSAGEHGEDGQSSRMSKRSNSRGSPSGFAGSSERPQAAISRGAQSTAASKSTVSSPCSPRVMARKRPLSGNDGRASETGPASPHGLVGLKRCMVRVAGRPLCLRTLHKLVRRLGGNSLLCSSSRAETYSSLFKQMPVPPGKLGSKSAPGRIRKAYRELLAPLVEYCGGLHAPDWGVEVSAALRVDIGLHLFQREWTKWIQDLLRLGKQTELAHIEGFFGAVLAGSDRLVDHDVKAWLSMWRTSPSPSSTSSTDNMNATDSTNTDPRSIIDNVVTLWLWSSLEDGPGSSAGEIGFDDSAADFSAAQPLRNLPMVEPTQNKPAAGVQGCLPSGSAVGSHNNFSWLVDSMPESLIRAPVLFFLLHAIANSQVQGTLPAATPAQAAGTTDSEACCQEDASWMCWPEKVGVVRLTVRHAKHSLRLLIPRLPAWAATASLAQLRAAWLHGEAPMPLISATGTNNSSNTLSAVETKYAAEPRDMPEHSSAWRFRALWVMAQKLYSRSSPSTITSLALPPGFNLSAAAKHMGQRSMPGKPHSDEHVPRALQGLDEVDPVRSQSGTDPTSSTVGLHPGQGGRSPHIPAKHHLQRQRHTHSAAGLQNSSSWSSASHSPQMRASKVLVQGVQPGTIGFGAAVNQPQRLMGHAGTFARGGVPCMYPPQNISTHSGPAVAGPWFDSTSNCVSAQQPLAPSAWHSAGSAPGPWERPQAFGVHTAPGNTFPAYAAVGEHTQPRFFSGLAPPPQPGCPPFPPDVPGAGPPGPAPQHGQGSAYEAQQPPQPWFYPRHGTSHWSSMWRVPQLQAAFGAPAHSRLGPQPQQAAPMQPAGGPHFQPDTGSAVFFQHSTKPTNIHEPASRFAASSYHNKQKPAAGLPEPALGENPTATRGLSDHFDNHPYTGGPQTAVWRPEALQVAAPEPPPRTLQAGSLSSKGFALRVPHQASKEIK